MTANTADRETLSAAINYAARGFNVFPCWHGQKTPATTNGLNDASGEAEQIHSWFSSGNHNIAIATGQKSKVVVIDEDTYAGGNLAALESELGMLPPTLEAKTRAGGRHLLFRYPAETLLRSFNGKIASHVDLKAQGGYIIAAPSWVAADEKGPAGKYEWVNDLPIAELPVAWCVRWESLGGVTNTTPTTNEFVGTVDAYAVPERIEEGQRNSAVLKYVGYVRGKGMPESLIRNAALDFNLARCVPPLDAEEVVSLVSRYEKPAADDPSAWPDPQPIVSALPNVKPFASSLLPAVFRPFVDDNAELMQIAPDFVAVPLMVAAAAAIGNSFAIAPKASDIGWLVAPVLWGGVVGRPGMLKSPALEKATRPLSILEAEMQGAFDQRLAQHALDKIMFDAALKQAKVAAAKGQPVTLPVEPEEPKPERIIVNDSTAQMLGEIQRHSPRGVLVSRDELVALLESLAAEGQEGSRGYYLEGWNGLNSYRVDRVGRGSFIIQRHALWVFGGIQPGRLQAYIRQAVSGGNGDDGLLQRFQMIVWPDAGKDWKNIDRAPDFAATDAVEDTFRKLRHLDPVAIGAQVDPFGKRPAYLHFTTEAQEEFNAFRLKLETSLRTEGKHQALESHLSKYRSLVPALALVIHLADGGSGPVTLTALRKAIGWSNYLWSHARRVYASVTNSSAFGAKSLADKVTGGKLADGFTAREVHRHGWQHLANLDDVRAALEWLVDAGWLVRAARPATDAGGRPTEVFNINPKVNRQRVSSVLTVPPPRVDG